jgi:hypothetical protein
MESARVIESYNSNLIYDTVPNGIMDSGDTLRLRARNKEKEIGAAMRYQSKGPIERLYDSITDRGTSNNTKMIAERDL